MFGIVGMYNSADERLLVEMLTSTEHVVKTSSGVGVQGSARSLVEWPRRGTVG